MVSNQRRAPGKAQKVFVEGGKVTRETVRVITQIPELTVRAFGEAMVNVMSNGNNPAQRR